MLAIICSLTSNTRLRIHLDAKVKFVPDSYVLVGLGFVRLVPGIFDAKEWASSSGSMHFTTSYDTKFGCFVLAEERP